MKRRCTGCSTQDEHVLAMAWSIGVALLICCNIVLIDILWFVALGAASGCKGEFHLVVMDKIHHAFDGHEIDLVVCARQLTIIEANFLTF